MGTDYIIKNSIGRATARIITILLIFLSAAGFVQAGFFFAGYMKSAQYSMTVVVIFLLISPFMFGAALFMAMGVHRIAKEKNGGSRLIIGYAFLVMASVDNLVYVPIHYPSEEMTSILILAAIEVVCTGILFFYLQHMGPKVLAVFGAILLVMCTGLEMIQGIYDVEGEMIDANIIYYMVKKTINLLFALLSVLLTVGMEKSILEKRGGKK